MCCRLYYLLLICLIGLVECKMENFIVGGQDAQIRQFPHAAFLRVRCNKPHQSGWICGSSIINQRILLTAAHCVNGCWNQNNMSISVGSNHKQKGAVSSVQSFLVHDEYIDSRVPCDIALIRVKTNLKYSLDIRRVAIMTKPPYFQTAQVAGWGFIKDWPKTSTNTLQYMDQYILTRAQCSKIYKMPEGVFCGSSKSDRIFSSGGDSGSALVVRGYIQIGVLCYRIPTIRKSIVVYTDIGYFYKWIVKNAKELYCAKQ